MSKSSASPMRRPDRVSQPALVGAVSWRMDRFDAALNQRAKAAASLLLPFYRRYPYRGALGLFTVDVRGAYSPQDGFFYNRVPKAGNSTVMATLAASSAYRRRLGRSRAKSRFLRPARMSSEDVRRLSEDAFRFTFVRDPYGRVFSAFTDKVARKRKQARPFYRWLGRDAFAGAPGFIDFLRFLDDGGAHSDAHWAPQTELMLLPVSEFDFVGRLERLEPDLACVMERIFGPDVELSMRRAGPRTDSHKALPDAYTPEGIEIVNRVYAADFETFGYPRRSA